MSVVPLGGKPARGLAATDLRSIPVATVLADLWSLQQENESYAQKAAEGLTQTIGKPELMELYPAPTFEGRYQRVSPDDVEHFRRVAGVYREAMRSPGRKRPTHAVVIAYGVSHSTATKWVRRARELKLLQPTSSGRPSAVSAARRKRTRTAR